MSKKTIKELNKIERPRERLMRYGAGKLSNAELLSILLRTGRKGQNVLEISKKILKKSGEKNFGDIKFEELKKYPGLGPVKACEIIACFELGRRFLKGKKLNVYLSPEDVWAELKDIRENKKEHFIVFYLDTGNQEIKREIISVGTLNYNIVHPREVFESAVKNLAAGIILAHNHPSGTLEPSPEDLSLNKRLIEAGKILGIQVLDHIIVTQTGFSSFKEKGLM
ncbi:MAG: DNA repair protein RadC [Elusimicrobiales bacterium]|nr:DNA repair protein RadC [Elusimicrobiales bacterium]